MRIRIIYIDPFRYDELNYHIIYRKRYQDMDNEQEKLVNEIRWNKIRLLAKEKLTESQYAVFLGFAKGKNGKEIGRELGITKQAVSLIRIEMLKTLRKYYNLFK